MTRGEAIAELVFAVWDAAPAAIACTALEERAARFGVCLAPEETPSSLVGHNSCSQTEG
ncbi:hypothetical protein ABZ835_47095 [Streptomyces sp. NPDC047461]|uniref:hypothetical protein n=1 Tax=Streptomyces sp. NPDC047461 TaxID=3155619 RepID=UPI0033C350BA